MLTLVPSYLNLGHGRITAKLIITSTISRYKHAENKCCFISCSNPYNIRQSVTINNYEPDSIKILCEIPNFSENAQQPDL